MNTQILFAIHETAYNAKGPQLFAIKTMAEDAALFNGGAYNKLTTELQVQYLTDRALRAGLSYQGAITDHTIKIVNKRTKTVYATITKVNVI